MRRALTAALLTFIVACGGAAPATTGSAAPSGGANAAATAQPTVTKLVVGYSEIYEGALPVWYAFEKGIFAKNFLDVDLQYTESSTGIAALVSNKTQIYQGGGSQTLSANVEGSDLVLIGNLVPTYPYVFMVGPDIKTIQDLKGKKVGVSNPGSTSDIATRVGLQKEGIVADKDVTIVAVGSSQNRTAALKNGSIQGGLDQPPSSFALEAAGFRVLFDMAKQKLPVVNNGIVVQRSYIASNRAVVQRYVDSIVQATAALRKDKAGAVTVYKKYLKDTDEALAKTYDYAMELFPNLPYARADQMADSVRVLGANNDKVKSYDLSKMLDESFVKSAADRGLDKG